MPIYQIDPIRDARWTAFVQGHARASVFHTIGWLQALHQTYGYKTVAFTASPPSGELNNALVFCQVDSWLTGSRLVSLPFSDHCEPLCDSTEELSSLVHYLRSLDNHRRWKYVEIRPTDPNFRPQYSENSFSVASKYFFHSLDLHPDLDQLFRGFDRDSVQRRVGRAERAGLREKRGRSEELLEAFYALFLVTRSRHGLPPSPYIWFQNLTKYLGDALEIRLAYKDGIPISAILTLRFKDTVYYKYGCSDVRFNGFAATPWLLWRAISGAKSAGAVKFDFGRTEEDNLGLLTFKNHWAPRPGRLVYWRSPPNASQGSTQHWKMRIRKGVFSLMPNAMLKIIGKLLYRHVG